MASEWRETTVGEFCPFLYGKNLPSEKRRPGSVPVVSSAGISGCHDEAFVKTKGIVIGRKGTVGSLTYCDKPFWPIDTAFFIKEDPALRDLRFTYYLLKTLNLSDMNSDSAVPGLNRENAHARIICVPPRPEQKAIAKILSDLDDKIELNRKMNATLEQIARALFKSWFVDFDPVRAKLDGKQPAGMDKKTADLFPGKFQDSSFGPIPQGWRACTLDDIAQNCSITFDFRRKPEVIFINTGDVLDGDFLHSKRITHVGLPGQAKKSIRPDDILFSEIRPANKRYAYVDFDSSDYVVSTKFMIIRGSKEIHPRLLYRILTAKETLDEFQVQAESRSGTFPQITFDSISHLPIVLPPMEVQEAFQKTVGSLDAQIQLNKQQSHTLVNLRDSLLPNLLSGEVRVGGNRV